MTLATCPLAAGPFPKGARRCDWCGAALTGRARRWCSQFCSDRWWENHGWTTARAAAVLRDGNQCQRCGCPGVDPAARAWRHYLEVLCPRPPIPAPGPWFAAHSLDPDDAEARNLWRTAVAHLHDPWRTADKLHADAQGQAALEVHHLTPIQGAHGRNGCHHHLAGLVTLCHRCHVKVTAEQRAAGLLDAPPR